MTNQQEANSNSKLTLTGPEAQSLTLVDDEYEDDELQASNYNNTLLELTKYYLLTLIKTPQQFRNDIQAGIQEDRKLKKIFNRLINNGVLENGRIIYQNSTYVVLEEDL